MLTLIKPTETVTVSSTDSLARLIYLDEEGFRPPERELDSHAGCAKNELPDHECHGPHTVCPSCEAEFCSEEYADESQSLCDLCTDCWARYIDLFEYHHYPNNR